MRRIVYAGGAAVTGNSIAEALLEYASALANADLSATITIPVVGGGNVKLVLGPASQILAEDAGMDDDLEDQDFLSNVKTRLARLRGETPEPDPTTAFDWDF